MSCVVRGFSFNWFAVDIPKLPKCQHLEFHSAGDRIEETFYVNADRQQMIFTTLNNG